MWWMCARCLSKLAATNVRAAPQMAVEEVQARRDAVRIARKNKRAVANHDESNPVFQLQLRVIRLLGRLGGRAAGILGAIDVRELADQDASEWPMRCPSSLTTQQCRRIIAIFGGASTHRCRHVDYVGCGEPCAV